MISPITSKRRILQLAAVSGAILASMPRELAAQGCALCYQATAAAGKSAQAGLRHGILILLVPALGVFGLIVATLCRRGSGAQD